MMYLRIIDKAVMTTWALHEKRIRIIVAAPLAACALATIGFRSTHDALWSDELLTTSLLQASSLPKLWAGIALGIDGNPPLYLTLAWFILQLLPKAVPSVLLLKLVNLGLAACAVAVLFRLARRLASPAACWIGALMFITLGEAFIYVASELRTYALYLLIAALAALCQQRLIEDCRLPNVAWLALANVSLAMCHTFAIAYVGIIAAAGWLSRPRDKEFLRAIIVAVVPSIIAVIAWSPSLLDQLEVAKPYSWILPPSLSVLSDTLFGSGAMLLISILEATCLLTFYVSARKAHAFEFRKIIQDPQWQAARFIVLLSLGITSFTLVAWLFSRLVFPLFVTRFFTPQLLTTFAVHVAFGAWLMGNLGRRRTMVVVLCAMVAPLMLRNMVVHAGASVHGQPICADAQGRYFESSFVHGDLPVIVDSAIMFLPRAAYAVHGEAYRFPLDWNVVLKYPNQSRGNAVDYHIMHGLQKWKPMPQVQSTDEILRDNPQFLVVDITLRSWFRNLRATHDVLAEKIAEVRLSGTDDVTCTLWKVSRVRPIVPTSVQNMTEPKN
ncbi:hypothetical protein J6524_15140 [Bradyrhizobium sp. WSM 1738]|uniref:hypothetical protein n=1 Tax=Bradyrhizobium hereditatis TaxID=2821405 RepID=UPI001CE26A53|nr:hypothetical protein [Bradyrhizobium hereditatis]MCA6116220.1 hypothetical protein [Bradyrhizobium hereditatis]